MDVSIVIVSYNTSRLLDECIQSIQQETRCSYEIIVVDNASTDDSCRMLREKHPGVTLIENRENSGFAKANNQGFAVAQGRYFFMLNPDTVILEGAIDKLVNFMDDNSEVGICGPRNVGASGELQYNCDHFPTLWNIFCYYAGLGRLFPDSSIFNRGGMRYWDYEQTNNVERIVGCSLLIRHDLFRQLDGLDENFFMYFEETDLCYRSFKLGKKTSYYPFAKIIHYGGESSKTAKSNLVINKTIANYFYSSLYYYFYKNHGLISMFSVRFLNLLYGTYILLISQFNRDDKKNAISNAHGSFLLKMALTCSIPKGKDRIDQ